MIESSIQPLIKIEQALEYEVRGNWLTPLIGFAIGQKLIAKYFVWKVKRKYKRYKESNALAIINMIEQVN